MKIERGRAEVARQAHNLKVVGSNPTPATKKKQKALHMRRSSNWLGSWIFIPATRIRIPVAVQKKIGRMVEWLQYQLVTLRGPGSNPGMTAASKSKYFCEVAA